MNLTHFCQLDVANGYAAVQNRTQQSKLPTTTNHANRENFHEKT